MKILVTGGFGTVGLVTVREALSRGHEVTVLARPARHNRRAARELTRGLSKDAASRYFRVHWGDLRDPDDLKAAVQDQEVVIHLAAMLPPHCDLHPAACQAVNVDGTENLVAALRVEVVRRSRKDPVGYEPPALVYASSVSVMGSTQHREPPVRVIDPPQPSDAYGRSKVAAESVVRGSAVPWAILRIAAVMRTSGFYELSMARLMFDMPLVARCEMVVDLDTAYAVVQTAENLCSGGEIMGKTIFVAGGKDKGWQMTIEDMLRRNLAPLGLRPPRRHLFRSDVNSYYLDWYDTAEGQRILGYQRHSVDDWHGKSRRRFRLLRWALWPVSGLARWVLGLMAPR